MSRMLDTLALLLVLAPLATAPDAWPCGAGADNERSSCSSTTRGSGAGDILRPALATFGSTPNASADEGSSGRRMMAGPGASGSWRPDKKMRE
jgi:hypothetical protein